jgi:hypothetical protein
VSHESTFTTSSPWIYGGFPKMGVAQNPSYWLLLLSMGKASGLGVPYLGNLHIFFRIILMILAQSLAPFGLSLELGSMRIDTFL